MRLGINIVFVTCYFSVAVTWPRQLIKELIYWGLTVSEGVGRAHSAGLSEPESSLADSEEVLRAQWGGRGVAGSWVAFSIWEVEKEGWLSLGHSVELLSLIPNIYSQVLFFNKMILKISSISGNQYTTSNIYCFSKSSISYLGGSI